MPHKIFLYYQGKTKMRSAAGIIFYASILAFFFSFIIIFTPAAHGGWPVPEWEVATPQEVGLNEQKLDEFATRVGGVGCIVKDGYMVKTWGAQTSKADWASAAKPVISTLLFFAVDEGLLESVDALVYDWGWDLIEKDQTMTFRHLANMLSGYVRVEPPGAAWAYNDYAIKLYALTMQDVFQQTLDEAVLERLAPLQFEDGSLFTSRGGLGISTTPRDFARIGWFWLNRGNWNGTQLLPQSYFDNYMKPGVPGTLPRSTAETTDYLGIGTHGGGTDQTPYGPGIYGFNWWFNAEVGSSGHLAWPDAPRDTFQANGHWGVEVVTIIPSLRMVVAARGYWGSFIPGDPNAGINQSLKLLVEAADTCEGNFNCTEDQDVDGSDAALFKLDYGRGILQRPCTNEDTCKGDFSCDGDVDGSDAFLFKSDFGRSRFNSPCPICTSGIALCNY